MAIGVYFHPFSMDAAKYGETVERLKAAGAGEPAGRLSHVWFGNDDDLMVFDIWDSRESFERFGEALMPILQDLGLGDTEPIIQPVHNIIVPARSAAVAAPR